MIDEHPRGTADRAVGVPKRTDNTKPKTTGRSRRGDTGDRFAASRLLLDDVTNRRDPRSMAVLLALGLGLERKAARMSARDHRQIAPGMPG